ncbi:hypothetical protein ACFLTH_03610 [Bacteroidota bacterium]
MKTFLILCLLILTNVQIHVSAQHRNENRNSLFFVSTEFFQIREADNLGMIFKGPKLSGGLIFEIPFDNDLLIYQIKAGLGPAFSRSMMSAHLEFKPVDIFYGFNLSNHHSAHFIGPDLKAEYNVEVYPYLHGGQPFWFTNYNLGIGYIYDIKSENYRIRFRLNLALLGLISRPAHDRDPYWVNYGLWDIISQIHTNFKFYSVLNFKNTALQVEVFPNSRNSSFSISYCIEYFGIAKEPVVNYLNQNIILKFSL